MSEEKREILEHLVEYLQQKIDSGEHKIFFNDLMWDEKTIDCINDINDTLEEIERLNNIIKNIENICESSIASIDNILQDEKETKIANGRCINRNEYQIVRLKAYRTKRTKRK